MNKMKFISSQDDWDNLLNLISEGTLSPIIGKEIFKYEENNELFSIDNYLSKKLLEKFEAPDKSFQSLTDTVNYLIYENKAESDDIITFLTKTLSDIKYDFPLLTDLLRISDLKFFINTTVFYDTLERKIKEVRLEDADFKNYSPYGSFSWDQDLSKSKLNKTFVFNAFGSLKKDPAISEEDMLEFTTQFSEKMRPATNLVNALQNNLLFLGCAYPDWITRFVLRLLTIQAMHEWGTGKPRRKIYVINDKSEFRDEQNKLLKNYSVVSYEGGSREFISELLLQWKKKYEKPKSIFLSYTRGDKVAVENLLTALQQAGNIKCWYDDKDLEVAVKWKDEIITEINNADLFIPLISNNSLEHKGFVEKEWDAAYNTYVVKGKMGDYIIPIVIDDTDPYDKRVPNNFTELNIAKIPQGNPDEKFLNKIKQILNLA